MAITTSNSTNVKPHCSGDCPVFRLIRPISVPLPTHILTDIPAGPIGWNFIYKIDGQEAGRQIVAGTNGGELRLPVFVLEG